MSQHRKLLERLKNKSKDFEWNELIKLLGGFGYELECNNGSRRKFYKESTGALIALHEPHPQSVLKSYQVREVLAHLKEWGAL